MHAGTTWDRIRRIDPLVKNGVLALLLLAIQGGPILLARPRPPFPLPAVLLLLAGTAPIAVRRRAPVVVLAVVGASAAAHSLLGYPESLAPSLAVAAGSAASWTDRAAFVRAVLPIALAAGGVLAAEGASPGNWPEFLSAEILGVGIPLLIGRILHHRRRLLERDQERATRDAVTEERARIARELHDVVAHAVSVIVVQAGAARTILDQDPERARQALAQIEDTGRAGLTELRRLLGVLEAEGEEPGRAPQPGLDRLDELLEIVRATGLPVEATVEGVPRSLSPGVDLAVYRLVQEALTNAMKHAGDAHAHVRLRYREHALDVEVSDDGRGPARDGEPTSGRGLIGMRERVAMFGGTLDAGERAGGGFVVHAHIPMEAT